MSKQASKKPIQTRPGRPRSRAPQLDLQSAPDPEANRRAAVVLEVLAGLRSPGDAAESLKISMAYYYVLEKKAIAGLVQACRAAPRGRVGPTPESQLAKLQRELEQCRNECQRQAALVRAAERSLGVPAVPRKKPSQPADKNGKVGRQRRKRKPSVRALQAAERLRKNSSLENGGSAIEPAVSETPVSGQTSSGSKESSDGTMRQEAPGGSGS